MSGPDQEPPQPGNRDEEIRAVSAVLGVSLDAAAKAIEDGLDVEVATELVRTQQVLRDQKELRQAVGDWLYKLTDEWEPFPVEEVGFQPFTRNDEALSKLIGVDGCVEIRFGVCVYDAECPHNQERSLIVWLEGTGIGSQSLHSIQERVRPHWLSAFQTDGHCRGCPTVRHKEDYAVVLEPSVWLKLTDKGGNAKQAILDGDVEKTLKRICRHEDFANEPEAERRLNVLRDELVTVTADKARDLKLNDDSDGEVKDLSEDDDGKTKKPPLPKEVELLKIAKEKCQHCQWQAWLAEQYAIRIHGEFRNRNLKLAWEWLNNLDNFDPNADELPQDFPPDLRGYQLPAQSTWASYVTKVRRETKTKRNHPRHGRSHGRSIAEKAEV